MYQYTLYKAGKTVGFAAEIREVVTAPLLNLQLTSIEARQLDWL